MISQRDAVLFAFLALLCGGALTAFTLRAQERERPAQPTRQWVAFAEGTTFANPWEVRVIDTEGVCLYVVLRDGKAAIAAVPKTQLPRGTGCQ